MIQVIRKVEVVTNIIKQEATAVDSFAGWDDSTEGQERSEGAGLIQGVLLKFSNSATWITRDDDAIEPTLELVAVEVLRVVQKWCDGKPVETKILGPGEKFPDIEAMNEAIPRDEWVEGPTGDLRGPWQSQHILYLVDLQTMEKYTIALGTVGGRRAIGELRDKIVWMRRVRGPNVYPVVTLSDTFMPTRCGGRQRPDFKIVRWVRLGGEGGEGVNVEALPPPSTPAPAVTLAPVQEPSIEEDFDDELPGDLAPPKKSAKASAKPSKKNGKPNLLQAG
jgi:hypothetical protein